MSNISVKPADLTAVDRAAALTQALVADVKKDAKVAKVAKVAIDQVGGPAGTAATVVTPDARATAAQGLTQLRLDIMDMVSKAGQLNQAEQIAATIDPNSPFALTDFGLEAQREVAGQAYAMIEGVKTGDTGAAGEQLTKMLSAMNGFDRTVHDKVGVVRRWFTSKVDLVKAAIKDFIARQQSVTKVLDGISDTLFERRTELHGGVAQLEVLYDASEKSLGSLEVYIAGGSIALKKLEEETIPALRKEVEASPNDARLQGRLQDAQTTATALDRRVNELLKVRAFTSQQLPTIRMIQKNHAGLIEQIDTIRSTTLPIWTQLVAQSLELYKSQQSAKILQAIGEATNDYLVQSAANLKQNTIDVQSQLEKGVIDVQALSRRNDLIIEAIKASVEIAEQGKALRREAEAELARAEKELGNALIGK